VEGVEADMADFERAGAFDAVLNLFTSWGYFEDEVDNLAVLERIRRSLRPGGRLVLETISKEILARIFQPAMVQELADGSLFVRRHRVEDDWNRIANTWHLIRDGREVHRATFRHWLYSARELRERLEGVGFSDVRVSGDLQGAPYDHEAKRLVVTARG
jgi:SAM-dependent methyltransferase